LNKQEVFKMANGHGGKRDGAGRTKKATEEEIISMMDVIASPHDALSCLWIKCKEGDTQAIKAWLEYRLGKPKQNVDVTSGGDKIAPPITWVKPDESDTAT
jgi:hypothetical protein